MIEAKDLRIGNLIIYENVLHEIHSLSQLYLKLGPAKNGLRTIYETTYDELFPIPLTPEVLEACGFEEYRIDRASCYRLDVEINDKKLVFLSYTDHVIFGPWGVANVEWCASATTLHQLQNLYYCLTGTEITYNNQSGEAKQ